MVGGCVQLSHLDIHDVGVVEAGPAADVSPGLLSMISSNRHMSTFLLLNINRLNGRTAH